MENTVKQRIVIYLKSKKLGQNKFERLAGLSNGYISNLKACPGTDKLTKIFGAAPDLNKDWLLYGEGEMLVDERPMNIIRDVTQGDNSEINQGCVCDDDDVCSDLRAEIAYLRRQNEKLTAIIEKLLGNSNDK